MFRIKILPTSLIMLSVLVSHAQLYTPSSGEVGIGISPLAKLHIKHSSVFFNPGAVLFENDNSTSVYGIINSSNNFFIGFNPNSGQGYPQSDFVTRFFIDSEGDVGIGTTNPNYLLDVNGQISYNGAIREGGDATLSSFGTVLLHGNSSTWSEHRFLTSGNQVLTINSLGDVGVGVNMPQTKLDVLGSNWQFLIQHPEGNPWYFGSSGSNWAVGGNKFVISPSNSSIDAKLVMTDAGLLGLGELNPESRLDIVNDNWQLKLKNPDGNQWYVGASGSGWGSGANKLVISPTGASTDSKLTIDNNGSVGIGTINPDSNFKLSVNGPIRAKEVKVEAGWSDFVFDDDYTLRPLEEVETYIAENHHLPEIPSEAEVSENGINLGEMNARLLQKIEEMTLYLIEQNKENQFQKDTISKLYQLVETQNERIEKLESTIK